MDFWLSFLPIVIYILLIIILVVGIILGVKSIKTLSKVEKVVDDVNEKVESLNGLFQIIDFTTDKIVMLSDKVVDGVSAIASKLFFRKKTKKLREGDKNE
ncbi:MAG: hypothetical protein K2J20_04930 [Bacilli bacterium]|nr:hypothetical protein [Bacilli bacterium]